MVGLNDIDAMAKILYLIENENVRNRKIGIKAKETQRNTNVAKIIECYNSILVNCLK